MIKAIDGVTEGTIKKRCKWQDHEKFTTRHEKFKITAFLKMAGLPCFDSIFLET